MCEHVHLYFFLLLFSNKGISKEENCKGLWCLETSEKMSNGSEKVILHTLFPKRFISFQVFNIQIFNERSFLIVSLQN